MSEEQNIFKNIQDKQEKSLAERVADQINQLILDRNIQQGDKLPNEFELAESLNVGRGTIREAVKLLVARNCLEIRRGKGTYVTEKIGQVNDPLGFAYVSDKVVLAEELLEVRLELEPWIAYLAAQRINDDEKVELKEHCDRLEECILSGQDHNKFDNEFHMFIAKCTHNSVLAELLPIVTYSIQMFTKFRDPELLKNTILTHREITNAICDKDAEKSRMAMYKHVESNRASIKLLNKK
jgi:DNA-binding FadR family transcriptional regulator